MTRFVFYHSNSRNNVPYSAIPESSNERGQLAWPGDAYWP